MTRSATKRGSGRCYILVANDIASGGTAARAEEIARVLLEAGFWAFSPRAPMRGRLTAGDRALIYLAGPGRRHFVARAVIGGGVRPLSDTERAVLASLGIGFLSEGVRLRDVRKLEPPVPIGPLVPCLRFITNRKYYGHNLRLPIVAIPDEDYDLILGEAPCYPE